MLIGKVLATNLARLMAERPDLNTQIKVAKKSGIGQTTVGRILRNEVSATADNIEAIACAFGLSVGELLSTQTNVGEPRHINSRERMLFDLFASLSRDEQNKLIHALEKKRDYDKCMEELLASREKPDESWVQSNPNRIYTEFKLPERSTRKRPSDKKAG